MFLKITGKLPSGAHLERLKKSPNYKGKGFQNESPTPMMAEDASYWKLTRDFFSKRPDTKPPKTLPSVKTDLNLLAGPEPSIVWFGHSSYLLNIDDRNILVDPVFSGNAAPLSFMIKAFPGADIYKPADMPVIDLLVLTHDHYDHLDYKTLLQLKSKVRKIVCSLGVSSHLIFWGYDAAIITELDWWEGTQISDTIMLTAAPARHFSGRGITRAQTLWSSFILKSRDHSVYLGGDSGYDKHFKLIGEKFGPFDLAILEAGQYNTMWPLIHMMPEETVQAALDLRAKQLLPVHWGKFTLAMHPWNEPVKRVLASARQSNLNVATPLIGERLMIGQPSASSDWFL